MATQQRWVHCFAIAVMAVFFAVPEVLSAVIGDPMDVDEQLVPGSSRLTLQELEKRIKHPDNRGRPCYSPEGRESICKSIFDKEEAKARGKVDPEKDYEILVSTLESKIGAVSILAKDHLTLLTTGGAAQVTELKLGEYNGNLTALAELGAWYELAIATICQYEMIRDEADNTLAFKYRWGLFQYVEHMESVGLLKRQQAESLLLLFSLRPKAGDTHPSADLLEHVLARLQRKREGMKGKLKAYVSKETLPEPNESVSLKAKYCGLVHDIVTCETLVIDSDEGSDSGEDF